MAKMIVTPAPAPLAIDQFLGINEDRTGETELRLGESPSMSNWRISENYNMVKMNGYSELFASLGSQNIQGMFYGKLTRFHFMFAYDGILYDGDMDISGTDYDSLDTGTYGDVDVVKTTAFVGTAGTSAVDGLTIYRNSIATELVEVAAANIDLEASIGKYYYHTDKTIWIIVDKGEYANIAAARTGLGTTSLFFQLGALTDAPTTFFIFNSKIYIQNGTEYKYYDGTTFGDVTGYRAYIAGSTPMGATGGGDDNEEYNLLFGGRKQTFDGDNSNAVATLRETAIDSVDAVYVDDVLQTLTTHYTVDLAAGQVTFVTAPPVGVDNVDIRYTNTIAGDRTKITSCRASTLYGGANDTRVHTWGNTSAKNTRYHSGLANGAPSAEYFPENNFTLISSDEFAITSIVTQQDAQIILKEQGSTYSTIDDSTTPASFPTFPLNEVKGNVAFNQARIVQNNPFTVYKGIQEFVALNVKDERNANDISKRVDVTIGDLDLTTAVTADFESKSEYWLSVGTVVLIFNYRLNVFYRLDLTDTPVSYITIDDELYFATDNGEIMRFEDSLRTYNGELITATWEMGSYDWERPDRFKSINRVWLSINPDAKAKVCLTYQTDSGASPREYCREYVLATFVEMDFEEFSFLTNYNPQPFRIKIKAKKATYFKAILTNESLTKTAIIQNLNIKAVLAGESK